MTGMYFDPKTGQHYRLGPDGKPEWVKYPPRRATRPRPQPRHEWLTFVVAALAFAAIIALALWGVTH